MAGEAALEGMSQSLQQAQAKQKVAEDRAKDAEGKLKSVEEQVQEKGELIKYVEEEVERVKGGLSLYASPVRRGGKGSVCGARMERPSRGA